MDPITLTVTGGVAAAVSLGINAHSFWKNRKWKKIHEERLAELLIVQGEAEAVYDELIRAGERLGYARVQASKTLDEAALQLRAVAKQYKLESLPDIPDEILAEWVSLQSEISQSLGIGLGAVATSTATAVAPSALYTAAGLFGVASTGTRISGLAGAAANSARLAWIGGGAIATGGGGVALGSTILNVLSKANFVTAPIGLLTAAWGEKKARDLEKKVIAELEEFKEAERKLREQITAMQLSVPCMEEIFSSVQEVDQALQDLLQKARAIPAQESKGVLNSWWQAFRLLPFVRQVFRLLPFVRVPEPDLHLPHQIYLTAKNLRELIEQPGIPESARRIIEE